jgi:nucleoside-diphosphate-sugar epimerase
VAEVTSLPDNAPHRDVDKIVLEASAASSNVKTAIVCPPTIYGQGRGPGNQRSIQLPEMVRGILQRKEGFYIGAGLNRWTSIHVSDLSKLYTRLFEDSLKEGGGSATWGAKGYYFAENGVYVRLLSSPPLSSPLPRLTTYASS